MNKSSQTSLKAKAQNLIKKRHEKDMETQAILKEDSIALSEKEKFSFIKKALKYAGKYKWYLIFAFIFMIIGNCLDLVIPVIIGKCIDLIIASGSVDFSAILRYLAYMGVTLVVDLVFTWLYNVYSNIYTFKTSEHIRECLFNKFNKVPLKYIDSSTHGDLLNRMINDVDIVTDGMVEAVISVSSGIITIVATFIFMIILNVQLAVVIAILTPISLVFAYIIARRANKLFTAQAKTTGEMSGYLEELIGNQRVVKAFNREDESINKFEYIDKKLENVASKAVFYSSLAPPFTRIVNGVVYGTVGLLGSFMALKGIISVGIISSFLSYANSFGKPFNEIANEITELQSAYASCNRVFDVLDQEDEPSDEGNLDLAVCDGTINVKDVSFSYTPKVKLIEDFNLDVMPGQKIAIVGPTGCGKSTFINLLMRFYDVNKGAIYISGHEVQTITRSSLRNKFGMVLQESWLFHGTIKENIAYGIKNAPIEDVIEAAKLAGAHDFIEKLPDKYNTLITEGGNNISQGQKQLICIARIMLLNPPMLILDEATSNIDTRTELKIQEAFNTLMKGRTSFIVAHRLSTIKDADLILVMNKGNIIEQGNHKELLKKKGFYYNLYNSQFVKTN